jgi:riboflavin kinase/FMN adenylyltransferase
VEGTSAAPTVEAHLFDFDGDLYDKTVRVAFVSHIREERKFPSLDALKAQIALDAQAARERLR